MRKLILLVIFLGILIGTGILTVKWGDDTFSFHVNKDRAKEKTAEWIDDAKQLEARIKDEIESDDDGPSDADSSDAPSDR